MEILHANMLFLTLSIYPDRRILILIVMAFRHLPLWCIFCCYFQNHVTMTICKMGDKPFDILTKNRNVDMTSVNWVTRLVDECEVTRRKEWPRTDKRPSSEEKPLSYKAVHWNTYSNYYHLFWINKTLNKLCFFNCHQVLVLLLLLRS